MWSVDGAVAQARRVGDKEVLRYHLSSLCCNRNRPGTGAHALCQGADGEGAGGLFVGVGGTGTVFLCMSRITVDAVVFAP